MSQPVFHNKLAAMLFAFLIITCSAISASALDVGAWYGTNNTATYNSPTPNASGGVVQRWSNWSNSWSSMASGDSNAATPNSGTSPQYRVVPNSGYQIKFLRYGVRTYSGVSSWTSVTIPTPTAATSFTISNIQNNYAIWAVFELPGTSTSYTVTAKVHQDTVNTQCNASTISVSGQNPDPANPQQAVATVLQNGTATFNYTPVSSCEVESVQLNSGSWSATTSYSYTTPAITVNSTVTVKFRPATYTITASVAAGSGSISPVGATAVVKNASQVFSITPTAGSRIVNVRVTDTTAGFTNKDLGAISSYTFKNVSANGSIAVTFAAATTDINAYCNLPPYLAAQIGLKPNVLLIFDNSGSMAQKGYQEAGAYFFKTTYYGYFDPDKMYKLSGSTFSIDSAGLNRSNSCSNVTQIACSGNRLNYDHMAKVDVIRKVMVGGKVENRTTTTGTATRYLLTDDGYRVPYGPSEPTGIIQDMGDRVRFGLMVFNPNGSAIGSSLGNSDGGSIISAVGATTASLVAAIEGSRTDPGGYTPLAESMYEAVRYFQAKTSAYNSGTDYGTSDPIQYSCQKNFVLLLTDGEPTNDENLPGNTSNGGSSRSPTVSDADFNVSTWYNKLAAADRPTNGDGSTGSTKYWLPAVAFYAHNTDLRSATVGKSDLKETQNITLYSVYAFGDGSGTKTLKMASKYGGYSDTNKNATPDLAKEYNAAGVTDGDPDNYFEASDGDVIETSIRKALSDVLSKISSGTAASLLGNSDGSGSNILQAVFYPNKIFKDDTNVDWISEMQNLWFYVDPYLNNNSVREDTDFVNTTPLHKLDLKKNLETRFYFNTELKEAKADLYRDNDGNGSGDTYTSTISPDDVKSIWRAGQQLWARSADDRNILTSINGTSLLAGGFTSSAMTTLRPYLQAADDVEADRIISFTRGTDQDGYRKRKVAPVSGDTPREWKLGDIMSSTPRIQSIARQNGYNLDSPSGYEDYSYSLYVNSANYKKRGMVYVGANDGMLHAFKLGLLNVKPSGNVKATLSGADLGKEEWAYIPRNALPFLKYYADLKYNHVYSVDGNVQLFDASISKPTGCLSDYWNCPKTSAESWSSVLVGGMGLGGGTRNYATTCNESGNCVNAPTVDPVDSTKGLGYSSYFALDISNQYYNSSDKLAANPTLLWEFSHPKLGYATPGVAVVRINSKNDSGAGRKNGRWLGVIASGPTGPIDTANHQFMGRSDQNLYIFVIDLKDGKLLSNEALNTPGPIDTGIARAFAGPIANGVIDTDRWSKSAGKGNYQDDAVYIGYTRAEGSSPYSWTKGGVLRIVIPEDTDPDNIDIGKWKISTVIDNVGPVTSSVAKMQDRKNHNLWLYFGTGRYYFAGDDPTSQQTLYAVKDACYKAAVDRTTICKQCDKDTPKPSICKKCDTKDDIDDTICAADGVSPASAPTGVPALSTSSLTNQSGNSISDALSLLGGKGWYVNLSGSITGYSAERNLTEPVALTNGCVLFSTFMPTSDICSFGGNSYLWMMKYDTGYTAPDACLQGKAVVQVSTGAFEQKDFKTIFKPVPPGPNPPPVPPTDDPKGTGFRRSDAMTGKQGENAPPVLSKSNLKPAKKIIHIQER